MNITTGQLLQWSEVLIMVALDRAVANSAVPPTFPFSNNFFPITQVTGSGTLNSGLAIA